MAPLTQMLSDLHHILVLHFRPTWLALTVAVAIGSAWVVGRSRVPGSRGRNGNSVVPARRRVGAAGFAALGILAIFLIAYIALILVGEHFAYYDNEYFTLGPLKGHDIGPPIWPVQGRFFPLGFQEFNLIGHFTDTAIGYHVFPIVELLLFLSILLVLDQELDIAARTGLAILALLTPGIFISFGGLIFSERNELLFLAFLVLSVKRFEDTGTLRWAVGAVISAQIMVYYKETAFLLLLTFAAARLLLRCSNGSAPRWDYHRLWDRQARLDLSLVGVAGLFLLYYLLAMGLHRNMNYAHARWEPFAVIVLAYTRLDLLAWLLVVALAVRLYLILRGRAVPLPLWDGLAAGGVAYLLAYLGLHIFNAWYLAPADLIAVLYVGRFLVLSWETPQLWRKCAISIAVFIVALQNVGVSAIYLYERKNGIHAKVEIARLIAEQYRNRGGHPLTLFFPFSSPYVIMEFAAYLGSLGVPAGGTQGAHAGAVDVALAARAVFTDGRCVEWTAIRCRAARRPVPGDLVIVLPDDEASRSQAAPYLAGGEIFAYEPWPPVPGWARAPLVDFIGRLRIARAGFGPGDLPDRWLDASVTRWQ